MISSLPGGGDLAKVAFPLGLSRNKPTPPLWQHPLILNPPRGQGTLAVAEAPTIPSAGASGSMPPVAVAERAGLGALLACGRGEDALRVC